MSANDAKNHKQATMVEIENDVALTSRSERIDLNFDARNRLQTQIF